MVKASGEATEAWLPGVLQHRSIFHFNVVTEVTTHVNVATNEFAKTLGYHGATPRSPCE